MKALAAALVAVFLCVQPAQAASLKCGSLQKMQAYMLTRLQMVLVAEGIAHNGYRVQIYQSRYGEWAMLDLDDEGRACVRMTGTGMFPVQRRGA